MAIYFALLDVRSRITIASLHRLQKSSRHSHGFWSNIDNLEGELSEFVRLINYSRPEDAGADTFSYKIVAQLIYNRLYIAKTLQDLALASTNTPDVKFANACFKLFFK